MTIFTYKNLYSAYKQCRMNKRKTTSALEFEIDLERNLKKLLEELKRGKYKPGKSVCFGVTEPKPREIFAGGFRDRVVHHLLVGEILEFGERSFFSCSFACRRNMGTHKAVRTMRGYIRKATRNGRWKAGYIQMDISNFFMSIDHEILFSIYKKFILKQKREEWWEKEMFWLGERIIYHRPQDDCFVNKGVDIWEIIPKEKSLFYTRAGAGLPIGNYSSQFFANLYLNELDRFVKQRLRRKYYVRYVDDFVILGEDIDELFPFESKIDEFLRRELKLRLNLKKTKLKNIGKGIDFLGYIVKPDYVLSRRRVVGNCKAKIRNSEAVLSFLLNQKDKAPLLKMVSRVNSYFGHFRHSDSFGLRKHLVEEHLKPLKGVTGADKNYCSLRIKKDALPDPVATF